MRRRQKRVPDTAQQRLAFGATDAAARGPRQTPSAFVIDDPEQLYIGAQRADAYLRQRGCGWIVQLRQELEDVDFTLLEVNYVGGGRPPYPPRMMLGLIVYGILMQRSTLRQLEHLAVLDVGAWWLCGGLQPDHSTIGDFVARHGSVLTEEFFGALVSHLVRRRGIGRGVVAGDGTVVESAASRFGLLRQEATAQSAPAAVSTAPAPADGAGAPRAPAALVAPSDPAAVIQPRKDGPKRPAYRPSILVHERGLIISQHVEPSSEPAAIPALLDQHQQVFGGNPTRVLLDANYHAIGLLQDCVEREIDVLCPAGRTGNGEWTKRGGGGRFGKGEFVYDAARNAYRCPAGQWLTVRSHGRHHKGRAYVAYTTTACAACALRARCTTSKTGRIVIRFEGDEFKEAMTWVLQQARARTAYRRRAEIVERPFAEFRERQGLRRFRRRGLTGVRVEFALHCIAFNLKWAQRTLLQLIWRVHRPAVRRWRRFRYWAVAHANRVIHRAIPEPPLRIAT